MEALTLDCQSIELNDEQFYQLCRNNPDLRFERNTDGDLLIISPTGGETGSKNAGINAQLWNWNNQNQLGKVFDSSTGFKLPNGANRSPDASWITIVKWNSLTDEQKQKFLPLCPDFASQRVVGVPPIEATDEVAIELLSPSDKLSKTQAKMTSDPAPTEGARERARMQEYLDNGMQLGWLINPQSQQVEIYRQGKQVEIQDRPDSLLAGSVLPKFNLDLQSIW